MSLNMPGGTESAIQEVTGYHFANPSLLWEALQAAGSGVLSIGGRAVSEGNKRLALLGDAALKLGLLSDWYEKNQPRALGSELTASVGKSGNLERVALSHGLDSFINNNPSQGRIIPPATLVACVQALLGAVFLDSNQNMEVLRAVMTRLGLDGPNEQQGTT